MLPGMHSRRINRRAIEARWDLAIFHNSKAYLVCDLRELFSASAEILELA